IRLSLLFLLFSASHDARHLLSFPTRRSSDLPDYGRWLWWVLEWVYGKVLPGAYAHEHITRYTRDELARRLRAAGYEILAWKYVGSCEMIFKARKPEEAVYKCDLSSGRDALV